MEIDILNRIERLLSTGAHGDELKLCSWFEEGDDCEARKVEFMNVYFDLTKQVVERYGTPEHQSTVLSRRHDNLQPKISPNDFGRVGDLSSWVIGDSTIFLCVSSHDADTTRELRLEISRKPG